MCRKVETNVAAKCIEFGMSHVKMSVLGATIFTDIRHRFPEALQPNTGQNLALGLSCFLRRHFEFIICLPNIRHYMV
jgi:hypothetical protein